MYDGEKIGKKIFELIEELLNYNNAALRKEKENAPSEKASAPYPNYNLGNGYALAYEQKPNGFGGYAEVNIRLYKEGKLIRRMTDSHGKFLDFPGVEHGDWEKNLSFPFKPVVRFVVGFNPFDADGLAEFVWTVQPDGRYWEDEDGFGAEKDDEIRLYAKFDRNGRFVTPFGIRRRQNG